MRMLDRSELALVSGGSGEPTDPPPGTGGEDDPRNNNGYGNGGESGPPPGHSGDHNPQLTGPNSGPRGDR